MAEMYEWTTKGASLTDGTAEKEYGVSRDFLVTGIRAGQLEYREASMWGNPCFRLLRSQVEKYINEHMGPHYLESRKTSTELRKVKTEIASLKRKMTVLQARKTQIENSIAQKMNDVAGDGSGAAAAQ